MAAAATAAAVGLSLNAVKSISSRTAVVSISVERPRAAGISDLSDLGLLVSTTILQI